MENKETVTENKKSGNKVIIINILKNYSASRVNTNEFGDQKNGIIMGSTRALISPQCQVHSWFTSDYADIGDEKAIQTKRLPEIIYDYLVKENINEKVARAAAETMADCGKSLKKKNGDESESSDDGQASLSTKQVVKYTPDEISMLCKIVYDIVKDAKIDNDVKFKVKDVVSEMKKRREDAELTLDIIFNGRFATGELLETISKCLQVSFAISTNEMVMDMDDYNAMDSLIDGSDKYGLKKDEKGGAGFRSSKTITSNCMYGWASLDESEAVRIAERHKKTKEEIINKTIGILEAMMSATPAGGQGSAASKCPPSAIIVDCRTGHENEFSYHNAFETPVYATEGKSIMRTSIENLVNEITLSDKAFPSPTVKRFMLAYRDPVRLDESDGISVNCSSEKELLDGVRKFLEE